MHKIIEIVLAIVRGAFLSRAALHTEILALRQQVAVLKRQRPRPSLRMADRVFWVILSRLWPGWRNSLVIVKPETVIGWYRKGFRLFSTWRSRRGKPGRPARVEGGPRSDPRDVSGEPSMGRTSDRW